MAKTNKQIQKELDKQKYELSEQAGCDLSGKMPWCGCCESSEMDTCCISHKERVYDSKCAKAFKRFNK